MLKNSIASVALSVMMSACSSHSAPPAASGAPPRSLAAPEPAASERAHQPGGRQVFESRDPAGVAETARAALPAPCAAIKPDMIYRFVDGIDRCLTAMTLDELAKLDDPFAQAVLEKGQLPGSVDEVVRAMAGTTWAPTSYVVGEGSQVPTTIVPRDAERNLRYVITWGPDETDARAFLSAAPGGNSSFLQVIAWDGKAGRFNFYERRAQIGGNGPQAWSFAGESSFATRSETRGRGCFDCHHNGVTIMKELTRPWNNWHSELATISSSNVSEAVAREPLFQAKKGADVLEGVIRGRYQQYYQGWLRARFVRQPDGTTRLADVDRMLRHLITGTTVNFAASQVQSRGFATTPSGADVSGIPSDLLLWDSVLGTALGFGYKLPKLVFARADFDLYVKAHEFELVQHGPSPYADPGSTWFSLFAPVPAGEDLYMVTQLRSAKIVSDKFIAAVLLVDFPNPVMSGVRSGLQAYADQLTTGTIDAQGTSSVPLAFAERVRAAAASQPRCVDEEPLKCSAEQQFLATWELSDQDWRVKVTARLQAYLDRIGGLGAAEQLDTLMRLANRRRQQFTREPLIENLNEFSLLLPKNNLE